MPNYIKILLLLLFIFCSFWVAQAQVSINENNTDPDASAMLDVSSTDKGILIPRMTTAERIAIANPATGLLVYDNEKNSFWYYNGTAWTAINTDAQTLAFENDTLTLSNGNSLSLADLRNIDESGLNLAYTVSSTQYILDIAQTATNGNTIQSNFWQSFTPNYDGFLVQIDVNIAFAFAGGQIRIYEGEGTSGTELGALTLSSLGTGWQSIDLSALAIETEQNQIYTFRLNTTNGSFGLNNSSANPYAGGISNISSDRDLRFRTYYVPALTVNQSVVSINDFDEFNLNNIDTLHFADGTTLTSSVLAFSSENGVTTSVNNTDNFVFGTDGLNHDNGTETKFFFNTTKGVFRAGTVNGDKWDDGNLGAYSMAFGYNTSATGDYSAAWGVSSATEDYATAWGGSLASAQFSTSWGFDSRATASVATCWGDDSRATAYAATAWGYNNDAQGDYSTVWGYYNEAPSYSETVLGSYATTYTAKNASSFDSADRLFVIGNGTNNNSRSDAMIVYKSGNTEINGQLTVADTVNLSSALIVNGQDLADPIFISENGVTYADNNDDFIIGDDDLSYGGSGNEEKLFFDKGQGAFRTGRIQSTNWDNANLGTYSFATGNNTIASGSTSAAFGFQTMASGVHAIAGGNQSEATANLAFAYGREMYARSFGEIALGLYGTDYAPKEILDFDAEDRLFSLGNGTGNGNRSDAMVVYKSGNTEINGQTTIKDAVESSDFILTVENAMNDNTNNNNGIEIIAGHDTYNSNARSGFIRFSTPNGTTCGRIVQNGSNAISTVNTSDIRLKENILPTQYGLSDILKINVRDYNFKSDPVDHVQTGFLAQQLYEVFPTVVIVGGADEKTDPWMVDYSKLTPLLVKGVQDLSMENEELGMKNEQQQAEIDALKIEVSKIQELEQQNAEMKAMLEQIQAQLNPNSTNNEAAIADKK
ncbi:MAG: tail fiber domain-containing protein [Bacteroidota bacterium]